MTWKEYDMQTTPPIHLYIQLLPGNEYYISYAYGLWDKSKKEVRRFQSKAPLRPNIWYTFENKVRWSTEDKVGYSIPKINSENLVDENIQGKIYGRNMYNFMPNYFKMGLYANNKFNDTISVLIDDFSYILRKGETKH
ncbi:MAG: hypothetical protein COZ75_13615 [Flavobacteriaceae bacterium CG_4_8_14_3_um_filter_34_10]|nr:hypothetical protein [Flavobacteriia bacterium]OIP49201.1 MAG: hypothetical protein AUK33_10930 [Flavobacteriaceae bacterium CG2_30_34_30]PIQ19092.1 MAG: hypothetical protein COW66_02975 [Flavobacteriaceae bacterium CG18_big_fil_WC_8_21_14_2_50_34_36]PIV49209.1 MAG: hypothetical protein COS19_09900 [Flavobacteriaceae bacterium CG02_land_8_20_14_3_00_34_13]PIX08129.1 MAG: hypothetical protein COZ75_13615 [Flavobacteriaceae bacterium CG_4_8_14_3_um_filter_34_10]PIZ08088.1 MAG: hypothetical pr